MFYTTPFFVAYSSGQYFLNALYGTVFYLIGIKYIVNKCDISLMLIKNKLLFLITSHEERISFEIVPVEVGEIR